MQKRAEVSKVVEGLFPHYLATPSQLPARWQADIAAVQNETVLARIVSDYIAGMTDRFALLEHDRIFGSEHPAY
jgi:dGTPase